MRFTKSLFLSFCMLIAALQLNAQSNIRYGENYVVFEAEDTSSPLGKWTLRKPSDPKYYKGNDFEAINQTYIEYNGGWATKESPLAYTFTCPKTGDYRLVMRMYQPLGPDEAGDKKNDVFIKLEGNYTSATTKPKTELEQYHKFWGRGVRQWGTCHSLEIGNHAHATYGLIEGEEYTLTMAGRSPGTSIDYILFYEDTPVKEIKNQDLALQFPDEYRPAVEPTAITLVPSQGDIRTGTTLKLKPSFEPVYADNKITWSSSNEQVLTVDENGVVSPVGSIGESATITVTSNANGITATSELTIVEWYAIPVTSIAVTAERNAVAEGQTLSLHTTVLPVDADDSSVTWSSSDETKATVNANGVVTGVATGTVTIRATSNEDNQIFGEISIEVGEYIAPYVRFDDDSKYLNSSYVSGDKMDVTIDYHAGSGQTVNGAMKIWLRHMSSDWQVIKDVLVEVDDHVGTASGSFTASIPLADVTPTNELTNGEFYFLFVKAFYTGSTENKGLQPINIIASSTGTAVASVNLSTSAVQLDNVGDTHQLTASVLPSTASDKAVTWSSSDETVASVSAAGLVTAIAEGKATITVTTNDGSKTATAAVNVGVLPVQAFTWTAKLIDAETDIITDGTLLEAINFAGGTNATDYNTTINGVPFVGKVNGNTSNGWADPETHYFSSNSIQVVPESVDIYDTSVGLPVFDKLLSNFLWDNAANPSTVTLSNLEEGATYKIQLLAADTRDSQAGAYVLLNDEFGTLETTTYSASNGLSIIGEFTAISSSVSFTYGKVIDGFQRGINLNAYQLRKVEDAVSSLEGTQVIQGFDIVPNPANSWITISSLNDINNSEVTIYNLNGEAVYQRILNRSNNRINISTLKAGLYLVKLNSKGMITTKKLIVR